MNKERVHIRSSAWGIGDAICASYVAAGARRDHPDKVDFEQTKGDKGPKAEVVRLVQ